MTEKAKPRARRKTAADVKDATNKLIAKHRENYHEWEESRRQRKKAADPVLELLADRYGGFYTPVDGWKFTPHAATRMTIASVAENERAYGRLSYRSRQEIFEWAEHRDQMI